jgi:dipeptidase D
MAVLSSLKPAAVWRHFESLCGIPHPSGHEEGVATYIEEQARALGLPTRRDEPGNVVVTQPATPGHEKAPTVVLQGHMDMVGVAAPGVKHDFLRDPIRPVIQGERVCAQGTTLGADNGIGGAIMLALMEDKDVVRPQTEYFFTVNEEAGMDGAHGLKPDFLKGRRLINLDTEEFGQFYISCAGGGDSVIDLVVTRPAPDPGTVTLALKVGGLKGGHSGADIHLGRGSGNAIIARLLSRGMAAAPFRLRSIQGGTMRNAIADHAEAVLDVKKTQAGAFRKEVGALAAVIQAELARTDPGLEVSISEVPGEGSHPIDAATSKKIVQLLVALPQGVLAMSPEVAGLVETSTNIGTLESSGGAFRVVLLSRSAVTSALEALQEKIRTLGDLVGASVDEPRGYPGWKPDLGSTLLKTGLETFKRIRGRDAEVKAIHAGLECGLFSEKLPGVEMVSIGPTMANVHSPAECVSIPHVEAFYKLLQEYLKALA